MSDERDTGGRYSKGNPGGPGRPRRATEAARLATLNDVVTDERWREIVETAYRDAVNAFEGKDREKGRRFIADYALGRPRQTIIMHTDDDAWADEYADITDDELRKIEAGEIETTRPAAAATRAAGGGGLGADTPTDNAGRGRKRPAGKKKSAH